MHMGHSQMSSGEMLTAPDWLISSLGVLFLAFSLFYFYRLSRPAMVKNAIGFWDWEGEAGHAICMLAMASGLAPWLIPISSLVWSWILGAGTIYYAARALTWGRRLSYNKQWWDWAHSGMYLGMFTMFQTLPIGATANMVLNGLLTVFWLWFSGLYIRDSYLDLRARKMLSFGSDLAHLGMGLSMLVMSLMPGFLMNHGSHDMMSHEQISICTSAPSVTMVSDATFDSEVLEAPGPVVVLVYGGCEKCAAEIPIFENAAQKFSNRAKFTVVNKDSSEEACKLLGVKDCPALVIMQDGIVMATRLNDISDEASLNAFLERELGPASN